MTIFRRPRVLLACVEDPRASFIVVVVAFFVASVVSLVLALVSLRSLWFLLGAVPLTVPPGARHAREWRRQRAEARARKMKQRLTVEAFLEQERKDTDKDGNGGEGAAMGLVARIQGGVRDRAAVFVSFARLVARRAMRAASNIYQRIPDEPTIAHRYICLLSEDKNYRAYLQRSCDTVAGEGERANGTATASAGTEHRADRARRRKRERLLAKLNGGENRSRGAGPLSSALHAARAARRGRRRHSLSVSVSATASNGNGTGDELEYAHELDLIA